MPRRFGSIALMVGGIALLGGTACRPAPLDLSPLGPPQPTCPVGGCRPPAAASEQQRAPRDACSTVGGAPCGGAPAEECTARALSAWGELPDDRPIDCVAAMLSEACALNDPRACGFAGRLWLDGRRIPRDVQRGLGMLLRACDSGDAPACAFGARRLADPLNEGVQQGAELRSRLELVGSCWSGQADACYRAGLLFYFGRETFPRDRSLAARVYGRGCDLGDSRACNNLGDALAYGDGLARDVARAAALFDKACHLGEALGCANLGYMAEHGEGVSRDPSRALALYRDACTTGDVYGCLHSEMMVAAHGAFSDPSRTLAQWSQACERARDARACAFVGVMYEDGPDGLARDETKSMQAMSRACALGHLRACEWIKSHSGDDDDE